MTVAPSAIPSGTRILYLEDSLIDADLVRSLLVGNQPELVLTHVLGKTDYEEALEQNAYDIILADYQIPSYGGEAALAQAQMRRPDLPFVFVSGALGEEIAIESMKLGATDYVVKQRLQRLPAVVARALTEKQERSKRLSAEIALRESEAKFRHLAENVPALVWMTESDLSCSYLSPSWSEFTGQAAQAGLGAGWLDSIHPEDREGFLEVLRNSHQERMGAECECRLRHAGNGYRWTITTAEPRFSDAGDFLGLIGTFVDITERRRYEDELALRADEFQSLADNIHQLAWMADANGWIYWYNKRWFDYTGTTLSDMQGWGWRKVHHPDHVDRVVEKISAHFKSGETWEDTFPLRGRDGGYRWFLSRARCVRDEAGNIVRWLGTNTDITERLEADRLRQLLVNELNHRVKNSLATVRAIASQTMRHEDSFEVFKEKFESRILVFSNTHDLLTQSNWQGADLRALVEQTLAAHGEPGQYLTNGETLHLDPKAAVAISLALHELATNAVKHGALSSPNGRVRVNWSKAEKENPEFYLRWQEEGGPPVSKPTRSGFGTRLIHRSLAQDIDGEVDFRFEPEGLDCRITGRLSKQ